MKNNIIQIGEIEQYGNILGNKTLNLNKTVKLGFNVPKFIALSSDISKKLFCDEVFRKNLLAEVVNILGAKKYAVRSSALIEDGDNQSFAGQFLTQINLGADKLDFGILKVLEQANDYLNGDLQKFSIIIQDYIEADISGVVFTRNPNGDREMVIEYGFCEGEKIVSGIIKPEKISVYWNNKSAVKLPKFIIANKIIEKFKELEQRNKFPQDIEWCIKDNNFYVLQTRPITTISMAQYEQIKYIEDFLSNNSEVYYEKTDICEISPRPSRIAYDLLKSIYSENGPVCNVYKKYGVRYEDTSFLKIIGNELFVDKEKEIQGLLPSYSYMFSNDLVPRFYFFSKIIPTIKNFIALNKIKTKKYNSLFDNLKIKIEREEKCGIDFKKVFENFLSDYELIFEINLLSGLAIKKVNLLLKNEQIDFAEILTDFSCFADLKEYHVKCPKDLTGNSLDILDESVFLANEELNSMSNEKVLKWWNGVSDLRKKMLQGPIIEAITYNRLRELGRWLTVKDINYLRNSLYELAKREGFNDIRNIFFANLDDVLNKKIKESFCEKNKELYCRYNNFSLPSILSSVMISSKFEIFGVSGGLASGILLSRDEIEARRDENEKYILFTEVLSPDLIKYFSKISGIVSNNGGLLSHLAILARENKIPVIVGLSMKNSGFVFGDNVQIDGTDGKIIKI